MDNLLCHYDEWKGWSFVNVYVSVYLIFNNGQFYLKYYFLIYSTHSHFVGMSKGSPKSVPYWRRKTNVTEASSKLDFRV